MIYILAPVDPIFPVLNSYHLQPQIFRGIVSEEFLVDVDSEYPVIVCLDRRESHCGWSDKDKTCEYVCKFALVPCSGIFQTDRSIFFWESGLGSRIISSITPRVQFSMFASVEMFIAFMPTAFSTISSKFKEALTWN